MQFKIKLVTNPGDEDVARAAVSMIDANGVEDLNQIILEGEKIECTAGISSGQKLVIRDIGPVIIHDTDEMMARTANAEDLKELKAKARPPATEAAPKGHDPTKDPKIQPASTYDPTKPHDAPKTHEAPKSQMHDTSSKK
jgi:hypothetical protein